MKDQSKLVVLKYLSQIIVERSDEGMRYAVEADDPAYIQLKVPESFLAEFSALNGFKGMLMPGFMFWEESGLVNILGKFIINSHHRDALEYLHGDVNVEYYMIPESKEVRISIRESD